jgi:chromosome segregation ATPase
MDTTFALTGEKEPIPVTNQEEKELRRDFNLLSDYNRKVNIHHEIGELNNLLNGGKAKLQSAREKLDTQVLNLERFENNSEACHKRIDELEWELENLANKADKKISIPDVDRMIKRLSPKVRT